jgi:hypothetical protein
MRQASDTSTRSGSASMQRAERLEEGNARRWRPRLVTRRAARPSAQTTGVLMSTHCPGGRRGRAGGDLPDPPESPRAVIVVRPSITHSTGMKIWSRAGATPSRIIRSARSISPPLPRFSPRLSALALVGDHERCGDDTERQQHQLAVMVGRHVVRHPAEQRRVREPVDDRVEVAATLAGAIRRLGDRTVEEVVGSGGDEQEYGEVMMAYGDRPGRRAGEDQTRGGEHVRGEAEAHQPATDRRRPLVYRLSKLSVEQLSLRTLCRRV